MGGNASPIAQLSDNLSEDNKFAAQTVAPRVLDTDSQDQQNPWGPNFEYLESGVPDNAPFGIPGTQGDPKLVAELRALVLLYRQEGIFARRLEIRRIRQARLFWQELQYGWVGSLPKKQRKRPSQHRP